MKTIEPLGLSERALTRTKRSVRRWLLSAMLTLLAPGLPGCLKFECTASDITCNIAALLLHSRSTCNLSAIELIQPEKWPTLKAYLADAIRTGNASAARPTLSADLSGTTKWAGGVLGPDRRIYAMPYEATDILSLDPGSGGSFRDAVSTSGYWNKL